MKNYFLSILLLFLGSQASFAASKYCVGFSPKEKCRVVKEAVKEETALVKALKLVSSGPLKGQIVEDFAVSNSQGDFMFINILEGTYQQEVDANYVDSNLGGRPGDLVNVMQTISNVKIKTKQARGARYFEITFDRESFLTSTGSAFELLNRRVALFDFCGNEFTGDLESFPYAYECGAY